ncbi:actin cytoskeleton-regulatory complex protein PAN1-like [Chenopodium quinoa]|uniref:SAP domain-containing protein n=1 Tax=Chenopodium quinoa TaxID=63459 RepID=A0A803KXJ4_CHEQI|nr:actin cytoskeleton-regulatory complex protein PAN1-like [Chenopodium quinoa]XP_021714128.1 actin cytoskeleton-regulatory complex protein PAN1-like [Chenopodium quinoa]XP_021714129.1 actin cytoskeleton-regulatory complex protein PAN1-like [Chenopodium quinoa]
MKASSGFPVLDNRSIDQWKVTELKEELKRRKLTTRGLKEELVRRLDESLRNEMEAEKQEADNGAQNIQPNNVSQVAVTEQTGSVIGELGLGIPVNAEVNVGVADVEITKFDDVSLQGNSQVSIEQPVEGQVSIEQPVEGKVIIEEQESVVVLGNDQPPEVGALAANDVPSVGLGNEISESLSSDIAVDGKGSQDGNIERVDEGSRAQEQSEDIKPLHDDEKLESSDANNQVSEVSSSLGFPVKSNSISTDSVSFNEKNDLKDNIIADNVKLESDVKPEMVQPSSSDLFPDGGNSHPSDVEEPHENKVSVQETDNSVTNADVSQKIYSADLGSSEKLNLDRSSGDDSMEEDALESKHIDSNYKFEEVVEKNEKIEVTTIEEERPIATMDIDVPIIEKGTDYENNVVAAASTDKRKLADQEAVLNNEPTKRQRRWKTESNEVKEPQISNNSPRAAVKDVAQPAVLKRNLSGSKSVSGADEPPKEREVPPSSKPATNSLRIDRFLRPFTLKAVQELLSKTGTVTSFWMDHIKTHCYVTYSSIEEAMETRNAVYNLQWPPNGGRQLLAEFVDPEEVKARSEKPAPSPAAPVSSGPAVAELSPTVTQPSPRQQSLRQQMAQQPSLPPPPPLTNPPQAREWAVPPPPPPMEKVEAPIVTLDDLFRKTKATPRIYYLPLSDEQVAAVLEARSRNSKQ